MKFRPNNKFGSRDKLYTIILLLGIGIPLLYVGGGLYVVYDVSYRATMVGDVYEGEFITANYTRMSEMATEFEYYLDRDHLPFNYTLTVYWNNSGSDIWDLDEHGINESATAILRYGTAGDATIWTGITLAAECFRYAVAKKENNEPERLAALDMVKKLLRGVSLLIAVPSGGIGPEFPALLSRSVRPKDYDGPPLGDGYDQWDTNTHNRWDIFDGVGDYSDWLYKGYPSTDQHSGIFFGLGQCAKLVASDKNCDQWVKERVRLLAAQFAEHLTRVNFMLIDKSKPGYTRTTGQDFKIGFESSGFWVLSILKIASITEPQKYASLYHHWAVEKNYINFLNRDMRFFNVYNYYSFNINYLMICNLVSLEEHPIFRQRYEKIIRDIYYPIIRIGRNAWFNIGYIYMMRENSTKFQKDIEDQLMRFDVPRFPNGTKRIPERGGDVNGIPSYNRLYNLTDLINPLAKILYGPIIEGLEFDREILSYPRTVDMWDNSDFLWQRSTWYYNNRSRYLRQDSGIAYLLPYYMGRYCGIFPKSN